MSLDWSDKARVLKEVQQDGWELEYRLRLNFESDPEIVLAAVQARVGGASNLLLLSFEMIPKS